MDKTLKILDKKGSPVGEYNVDSNYIELEKGDQAVHDSIVAYRAAMRAGTASAKNRSEIKGTGSKLFRQKGTGRARAGTAKTPIWKGGGVAFGPKPKEYYKKINKKERALALKRVFSEKLNESAIYVLNDLKFEDHKTKNATELLNNLKVNNKSIIVVKEYDENQVKATGNIPNLILMKADSLNVYQLLDSESVIFTEEALNEFLKRLH